MKKEKYTVTGMTCSACSSHVEKSVRSLAGMQEVTVNLLTNSMQVVYDESKCDSERIISAVEKSGYGASLFTERSEEGRISGKNVNGREALKGKKENKQMRSRLIISILFMIPLMIVSMHHMIFMWLKIPAPELFMKLFHGNENALTFAFTQFLLVLPIIYVNRKYFEKGFRTLLLRSPNMDSLIAVGSGAALVYGIFAIYRIGYGLGHGDLALVERYASNLYFESAGMILTLITVGKYLETRSKGKTGEAIEKLMDLSPKTAILRMADGTEKEIPTEQLMKNDLFVVKPGSLIPVDGVIEEGTSSINEAAITGESIPVEKKPGDPVVSATMNRAGRLVCRATKVGEDTTLSQIIRLVEEASASKAPIARLADKIAGIFVPAVMGIAALTFVVWLLAGGGFETAMSCGIAVLVISCPCALGLATPVAIMVGTGVGAKNGILVKSGDALQAAKDIDTVVLDKTGTITEGKPRVTDILSYDERMNADQLLSLAAAIEKPSGHPLAEAIVSEALEKKLSVPEVSDFRAIFGKGVAGILNGQEYLAGNQKFMEENNISLSAEQEEAARELSGDGKTPLFFAEEKQLIAIIAVADTVKTSSLAAIEEFHRMKIDVVMLTGDNQRTAEAVQRKLGINQVIAEVLPEDKEKEIRKLQSRGRRAAMIGDGINDAPALAAADVGIAIGAGADVAIDSADIILMKSQLTDAITAIRLSRAVIRNIKENLFWAFFYNVIGIPLAAGVLYPAFGILLNPMFGAAAMSLSSLFVVGNALRLRNFKSSGRNEAEEESNGSKENEAMVQGNGSKENEAMVQGNGSKENEAMVQSNGSKENEAMVRSNDRCTEGYDTKKMNGFETDRKKEKMRMKKTIIIEGMACGHCTARVQKALEAVEGIAEVIMSLENKSAEITLNAPVNNEALKAAVTEAGYEVTEIR